MLAECAPGLGVKDVAEYVLPCYELEGGFEENYWTYVESCVYRNIGWLNTDTSINVKKFESIDGISEQVAQCMDRKKKRSGSLTTGSSGGSKRISNKKRSSKQRSSKNRKPKKGKNRVRGRKGRKGKNVSERKQRKGERKRKGQRKVRRLPREATSFQEDKMLDLRGIRTLRPEPRGLTGLREPREVKRSRKSSSREPNNTEKKKNDKKTEKKKKKKEEKKILKSIPLNKIPSEETFDQLWCLR